MSKQAKLTTDPNWPVGRIATRIVLFTREQDSTIEKLLKLLHETVNVVNPKDAHALAQKHDITTIPTVLFFYHDHEINRLEG